MYLHVTSFLKKHCKCVCVRCYTVPLFIKTIAYYMQYNSQQDLETFKSLLFIQNDINKKIMVLFVKMKMT